MKTQERYNTQRTRLIERYEENPKGYFDLDEWDEIIQYYLHRMHFAEARTAIRQGLGLHPDAPELLYYRIRLLTDTGKHEQALVLARTCIKRFQSMDSETSGDYINLWADTLLIEGEVLLKLQHGDEARRVFETLRRPLFGDPRYAFLDAAYVYLNQNLYQQALEWITEGLREFPAEIELLDMAAYCLANTDRYEEAAGHLHRIIDLDPYNDRAWMELGDVHNMLNNPAKAVECYDFATSINDGNLDAWTNKASAYYQMEAYQKAADCYLLHAEKTGNGVESLLLAADCYEMMDRHDDALRIFRRCLELQPENGEAMEGAGICEIELQHYNTGIDLLTKALALDPTSNDSWFYLGQAYTQLDQDAMAVAAFRKCLELDPNQPTVLLDLGVLFFEAGRYPEALHYYQEAALIDPETENVHLALALTYFGLGDIEHFTSEIQLAQDRNLESFRLAMEVFPECASYIDPLL
ncbi:MAG: tetratricopeptide repeat protein [Paludibacteraceae bacterium]|nr:tetratricopeptide repeat protein [Paludibacteraceae bacterium]